MALIWINLRGWGLHQPMSGRSLASQYPNIDWIRLRRAPFESSAARELLQAWTAKSTTIIKAAGTKATLADQL
jgi:hypothetical protein